MLNILKYLRKLEFHNRSKIGQIEQHRKNKHSKVETKEVNAFREAKEFKIVILQAECSEFTM